MYHTADYSKSAVVFDMVFFAVVLTCVCLGRVFHPLAYTVPSCPPIRRSEHPGRSFTRGFLLVHVRDPFFYKWLGFLMLETEYLASLQLSFLPNKGSHSLRKQQQDT